MRGYLASSLCLLLACALAHGRTIFVAPGGSDDQAGTVEQPLASPNTAVDQASEGDSVYLRGGRYVLKSLLWIDKPRLTVASYPKEKAVLVGGTRDGVDPQSMVVIAADGVSLVNLEIRGGAYYAVNVAGDTNKSTSGVVIAGCRIADSGRDCIKTLNADNLLIEDCEIGPSGLRDPSNAEGIDSIGSRGVTIRRCYIHDTATNGLYLKGGARDGVVEGCRIENTGKFAGIFLGQDTDEQWMRDGTKFEAIDCVARNNIIVNTGGAGLGTCSGYNVRFENNTLVDVARDGQAGVWVVTNSRGVPAEQVSFKNNIIVMSGERPYVFVRNLADPLISDCNVYFNTGGHGGFWREMTTGGEHFDKWALDQWRQSGADKHSMIADPQLLKEKLYRPGDGSPVIGRGEALAEVKIDHAGAARPNGAAYDVGAYQVSARPPVAQGRP